MLSMLAAFAPVAAVLTLTPGAATALVVRCAVRGGRREALMTTLGNSFGVLVWALAAAAGVAAVVAASGHLYTAVKLAGAAVLLVLGVLALRGRTGLEGDEPVIAPGHDWRTARNAALASLGNPKLAVFFVALFPQFVPDGRPVLPAAVVMALTVVAFDLVWFSLIAASVTRARDALLEGPWLRRAERLTGVVLIGLGVRLALDRG